MIDISALEKLIEEFVKTLDPDDFPEYPGVSRRDEGKTWMDLLLDFVKEFNKK